MSTHVPVKEKLQQLLLNISLSGVVVRSLMAGNNF
jgi:DNA-dependent RNA polymerase auxiliary subunit epsilon